LSRFLVRGVAGCGDAKLRGEFRKHVARARFDALFISPAAARLHSDYQRGMI
jgi:p-hydroxybenzoate 3-monooxygenase